MASKPGVMIYFETGRAVKGLDYETKGRLFEAIMDYAEHGTVPALDGVLAAVWPFIAHGIDRDNRNYEKTVTGRKRAAYAKWWPDYAEKNGLNAHDKIAKERWIDQQIANHANATSELLMHANDANAYFAMQTMPTSTPTSTETSTSTATGTSTGTGTSLPAQKIPARTFGRFRNVLMTDQEYMELLSDFPDARDRIEHLSEYLASSGKRYENHAATIRKWAREDAEKQSSTQSAPTSGGNVFYALVEEGKVQ